MKFPRYDRLLLILAVALLLAMAATLLFGTGRSRHGHGSLSRPPFPGQRSALDRVPLRRPRIDAAIQIVDLRVAAPR